MRDVLYNAFGKGLVSDVVSNSPERPGFLKVISGGINSIYEKMLALGSVARIRADGAGDLFFFKRS